MPGFGLRQAQSSRRRDSRPGTRPAARRAQNRVHALDIVAARDAARHVRLIGDHDQQEAGAFRRASAAGASGSISISSGVTGA